jgi:putative SOS response-associated peptidase YedK
MSKYKTKGENSMCGRYEIVDGKLILRRFNVKNVEQQLVLPNLDVRPSQSVPVLLTDHELTRMKWGLVPFWARDEKVAYTTINARAEGIESKSSFKRPLISRRCIIPASAFFEWSGVTGHKTKYRIARKDGDLFGFAGLYDTWRSADGHELQTYTVITTTPNKVVEPIHNRMPVILLRDQEEEWLNPDMTEPQDILPYLRPYPDDLLGAERAA